MVSVIIVSHGFFSKELLGSAEMIIGTQEDVQTVGFHPGESIDSLKEQMASALMRAQNQKEVLVLSDMVSGSPFNVAASLTRSYLFENVAGINLPILLPEIILGGMGAKEGRKKFNKNVSASGEEVECLKRLQEKGAKVKYQLVPDERAVALDKLL